MILASLLLILVAVILLVLGLVSGSSGALIGSIAASLLAAVALVVGARQAAAARTNVDDAGRADDDRLSRRRRPADGTVDPSGASVPTQHTPTSAGFGQPSDPRFAAAGDEPDGRAEAAADEALSDEPPAQEVLATDAARVARMSAEVLVVDGRPRYHLPSCPQLSDRTAEALPVKEAVELGFTPCGRCEPDSTLLADTRHG
ncbi:hypothetical protein GCM10027280_44370 [Micromonospora polyrhachis]|uniref:Uncharacterized protein n=1 Tax=Micromonospora polyrhachis TaxID=1282883 RepID=A0A7W7SUR5_9ACTN|nr:hypothetical protein [Micromonospora polyrhachis]MBB4961304.1 hypothetical protein [Micromonospora polyrhachis]